MITCAQCGHYNKGDARFCVECGERLDRETGQSPDLTSMDSRGDKRAEGGAETATKEKDEPDTVKIRVVKSPPEPPVGHTDYQPEEMPPTDETSDMEDTEKGATTPPPPPETFAPPETFDITEVDIDSPVSGPTPEGTLTDNGISERRVGDDLPFEPPDIAPADTSFEEAISISASSDSEDSRLESSPEPEETSSPPPPEATTEVKDDTEPDNMFTNIPIRGGDGFQIDRDNEPAKEEASPVDSIKEKITSEENDDIDEGGESSSEVETEPAPTATPEDTSIESSTPSGGGKRILGAIIFGLIVMAVGGLIYFLVSFF